MSTHTISIEDRVEIPFDLRTLDDFRAWTHSESFPEDGRIDYIDGRIEVDMSPENAFTHGTPKMAIAEVLNPIASENDYGWLFCDCTRIVSKEAKLSAEPDLVFITEASLTDGRVKPVPGKTGSNENDDNIVEFEGGPDLIVEIVSNSSVKKDTLRLPKAYFAAGVREFWLVDVRRGQMHFTIHTRGKSEFVPQVADADGMQASAVLNASFLLTRRQTPSGRWRYRLAVQ